MTLVLLLATASGVERMTVRQSRLAFEAQAADSAERLQARLHTYEQLLYAMRGLIDVHGPVGSEQFHKFAQTLLTQDRFPEVLDLSYEAWPSQPRQGAAMQPVRAGRPPAPPAAAMSLSFGNRDRQAEFVEPRSGIFASAKPVPEAEPDREATLERAMLSGNVTSSSFIPLSEGPPPGSGRGTVQMGLAVYRGGGVPPHASEREESILGRVAITVRLDKLARGTLVLRPLDDARVRLFETPSAHGAGRQVRGALLFDNRFTADRPIVDSVAADYSVTRLILMPDRAWLAEFTPLDGATRARSEVVWIALIRGISLALAFFAAWFTHAMLALARQRADLASTSASARQMLALGEDLHVCRDTGEAYAVLKQQLPTLLPETSGVLYRHDAAAAQLLEVVRWGSPRVVEGSLQPGDCQAIRRGQVFEGSHAGFGCAHVAPECTPAYMCVPLAVQGVLIGVLHVQWPEPAGMEGLDLRTLAHAVAQQIGLALANLQLCERMKEEADRDRLTDLYTRRFAGKWLEQELSRCKQAGGTLAAVMLDIDHFKRVNDRFGHDAGDRVLQDVSQLLRASTRAGDVACRYGGEEFLLLLPSTSEQVACERAEQIRADFEGLSHRSAGRDFGAVTVSAGVAVFPADAADAATLIQAADRAVYAAKAAGRNRVARSSRMPEASTAPLNANQEGVIDETLAAPA